MEIHLEQGPVLEVAGKPLGVVSSIAGQTRLSVSIIGTQVYSTLFLCCDVCLQAKHVSSEYPILVILCHVALGGRQAFGTVATHT